MTLFKEVPTQQELQAIFTYDDELGVLRWKIKPAKNINIGDIAGYVRPNGYTQIMINGVRYFAHRLIYRLHEGNLLSTDLIDHKTKPAKGEIKDNRIENLRKSTSSGNNRNKGVQVNSESGIKGVFWHKRDKKYQANISISGKSEHLGYFTNKFDAYEAYRKRCLEIDPISYEDSSKDMRPEVFIEYQEYLKNKQTNIFKLAA